MLLSCFKKGAEDSGGTFLIPSIKKRDNKYYNKNK